MRGVAPSGARNCSYRASNSQENGLMAGLQTARIIPAAENYLASVRKALVDKPFRRGAILRSR